MPQICDDSIINENNSHLYCWMESRQELDDKFTIATKGMAE